MNLDPRKAQLVLELRQGGVADTRVLSAIEETPRDKFVPEKYAEFAWDNRPLPIGYDQTISQPLVVGLMTQALELTGAESVLEVGTGSGYQTALLSRLAGHVCTIERVRELLEAAVLHLAELGILNVSTRVGDGAEGWPKRAPFDRIIVTAAAAKVPQPLIDQLADGGILVVPVGEPGVDQKLRIIRKSGGALTTDELGLVRFVPLVTGGLA
jgi:protein-L-isoaspartate(D-aspartate) O-methyltransferase